MAIIPPPVSDAELSAYADGETSPDRIAAIEAWLALMPAQAAKVKAWRRQNQALRAAFGRAPVAAPPKPKTQSERNVTPLFAHRPTKPAPWNRRDLMALVSAGSFLAGAGVACLAGYLMG